MPELESASADLTNCVAKKTPFFDENAVAYTTARRLLLMQNRHQRRNYVPDCFHCSGFVGSMSFLLGGSTRACQPGNKHDAINTSLIACPRLFPDFKMRPPNAVINLTPKKSDPKKAMNNVQDSCTSPTFEKRTIHKFTEDYEIESFKGLANVVGSG